jgi:thiamine-phosphate pyrophosphorylase
MQLMLLTPEKDHAHEIQIVQQCLAFGLQCLHLRKPSYTREEYADYLQQIDTKYHNRIVLHRHFELLETFDIGGIHFNTAMRNDDVLAERFADYGKLSASFHTWEEIEENTMPYHYVFISPVFDSISKQGYKATVDPDGINTLREKLITQNKHCPQIVGLGGVSAENIKALSVNGFDGAAVLGSIWEAADPAVAFAKLARAMK